MFRVLPSWVAIWPATAFWRRSWLLVAGMRLSWVDVFGSQPGRKGLLRVKPNVRFFIEYLWVMSHYGNRDFIWLAWCVEIRDFGLLLVLGQDFFGLFGFNFDIDVFDHLTNIEVYQVLEEVVRDEVDYSEVHVFALWTLPLHHAAVLTV